MARIVLIGAGSQVFTKKLTNDVLLTPALRDSTIVLMDVDAGRLHQAKELVEGVVAARGNEASVECTTSRSRALRGADYVITTFQHGGLAAVKSDISTPRVFGVEQCIGDTLNPGGIFRGLRTIPVLLDICREMDNVSQPHAMLLNYVNPMAINCWAISRASGRPTVGLCHSVQGTSQMLARWLEVPYDELNFVCAGINHQAFFLSLRRGMSDLYPALRKLVDRPELDALEPVRIELLKRFGYFVTESSGHASEYVPFFRKTAREVDQELVPRFADPAVARSRSYDSWLAERTVDWDPGNLPDRRSTEYGSYIIEAIETNRPVAVNANVTNRSLITNLPNGACVEVPCLVTGAGVQPTVVGPLPPQVAALNRSCISVQDLTVEAALTGNVDAVHQAALMDPLTSAALPAPRIHEMVDRMLEEQAPWLPNLHRGAQFAVRQVSGE